jgi:hypothetical protein
VTVTLPLASSGVGKVVAIRVSSNKRQSGELAVSSQGSDQIYTNAVGGAMSLQFFSSAELVSDGTRWIVTLAN